MNDEMQKRMISILSTVIAYVLASQLADRLIQEPEVRGVRDDVKEAVLQAGFSLASTITASFIIRRLVSGRWGS
ncbi:MAG: hypothetical protein M3317_00620 [Actinomycetota bacterium]|nr:hypothetical protein [Actinomycetota bacterium]